MLLTGSFKLLKNKMDKSSVEMCFYQELKIELKKKNECDATVVLADDASRQHANLESTCNKRSQT